MNTILWNDLPQEIYFRQYGDPGSITVAYCDVHGGEAAIVTNNNSAVNRLEGNIDADPLFMDFANGGFRLQEVSPCIDVGTAFIFWDGDTLVNLPDTFYFGNAPDMSAFESPYTVGIAETQALPDQFTLCQNYPNQFNPNTTVKFYLPKAVDVQIIVYDILGREVVQLVDCNMEPGFYRLSWNGRTTSGIEVPNGIYIARLATPEYTHPIKMVLLK